MSKPRGCKNFTHVQCDYNRCRGRDISAGHVKDCPFQDSDEEDQDSDEEDQDEGEDSDVENDGNEWNPVRPVKHKSTPTTVGVSSIGPKAQNTAVQATRSHDPWVQKASKASPKTPNTAGSMGNPSRPVTNTPSAPRKSWARAPMPPTHVTIRPSRK
ncbi:hypothetical protein BGX38DRAFT_1145088 [Terfezia claveryi]|nr:hypothetical protein BGX38DRAFT_1145088 [Terfezia claveryi]